MLKKDNPYKGVALANKKYKIPFDLQGNQLHYPTSYTVESAAALNKQREGTGFKVPEQWITLWAPNRPFGGSYKFTGISRGRSAAYFDIQNVNSGQHATMFMKDVFNAMPFFVRGYLNGTFAYTKKGANYGIMYLHDGEPNHDAILELFGPE